MGLKNTFSPKVLPSYHFNKCENKYDAMKFAGSASPYILFWLNIPTNIIIITISKINNVYFLMYYVYV